MNNKLQIKCIKKAMTQIVTAEGRVESCTFLQMPTTHMVHLLPNGKCLLFVQCKKSLNKPLKGQMKKYNLNEKTKGFFFETHGITEKGAIDTKVFHDVKYVSVRGITKGKGFAGVMKRHNFKGGRASHGNSLAHRTPGSTGGCQDPGKVMKGKKMPGHMGNEQRIQYNLKILDIDHGNNTLIVKGSVPGHNNSIVTVEKGRKQ